MTARSTTLAVLAALVAIGAGCGQDEEGAPIPADLAGTLERRLEVVQSQFEEGGGACADILDKTRPVIEQDLDQVPSDVDADVRSALRRSFDRLFELAESDCDEQAGQETTPTETETTPPEPPPETAPPETQATETTPPETQTEQLPPGQQQKQNQGGGKKAPPGQDGGGLPAPNEGENE